MLGSAGAETDEERWAQAESILAENPTPSATARIRRVRTMLWLSVVGTTVLGLAIGVLAVVLFGHGRHRATEVPAWQEITGLAVQAAGIAVEIAGIVILRPEEAVGRTLADAHRRAEPGAAAQPGAAGAGARSRRIRPGCG